MEESRVIDSKSHVTLKRRQSSSMSYILLIISHVSHLEWGWCQTSPYKVRIKRSIQPFILTIDGSTFLTEQWSVQIFMCSDSVQAVRAKMNGRIGHSTQRKVLDSIPIPSHFCSGHYFNLPHLFSSYSFIRAQVPRTHFWRTHVTTYFQSLDHARFFE